MKNSIKFVALFVTVFALTAMFSSCSFTSKNEAKATTEIKTVVDSRITIKNQLSTGFPRVEMMSTIPNIKWVAYYSVDGKEIGKDEWKEYPRFNIFNPTSALFRLLDENGNPVSQYGNMNDYIGLASK